MQIGSEVKGYKKKFRNWSSLWREKKYIQNIVMSKQKKVK